LAAISLVSAPMLLAQDSITIKDPAEFNSYQMASTQSDPKAQAAALESFLVQYPQSVVKASVLEQLMGSYQKLNDPDHALSAATRLLQLSPNNMPAIFLSVLIKKAQCGKTQDAQTCDDAAALARKGLSTPKPAETSGPDWQKQTSQIYPLMHSAMALDNIVAKKDIKAGIEEYRQELMLYPADGTKSGPGLSDTLQLAEMYARLTPPDMPNAVWFYARALAFAPPAFQPQIEKKLDYWYKKFHGAMDGLDDIKSQTAANLFPPGGEPKIKAAKTPAEFAHDVVTGGGLDKLNLSDKEFILANGSMPSAADATKTDADTMWAAMKDQATPVPGIVIEATASVIKVAVSDDAKSAKAPDFIVNLKKPLDDKDIPAVGFEFKMPPATAPSAALIGTMDSYRQVPATATTAQTAEIVVKDGEVQVEKKKAVPAHKPAAGHKTTTH